MINFEVRAAGDPVAWARIDEAPPAGTDQLRISLGVAAGPAPRDTRRQLVEKVFAQAVKVGARRVHVRVALGDS
jgi:hypothetical protein